MSCTTVLLLSLQGFDVSDLAENTIKSIYSFEPLHMWVKVSD